MASVIAFGRPEQVKALIEKSPYIFRTRTAALSDSWKSRANYSFYLGCSVPGIRAGHPPKEDHEPNNNLL